MGSGVFVGVGEGVNVGVEIMVGVGIGEIIFSFISWMYELIVEQPEQKINDTISINILNCCI
jgi:hypothetical protein